MIRSIGDSDRADFLHLLEKCFSELVDCGAPPFAAGASRLLINLYLQRNADNLLGLLKTDGMRHETAGALLLARIREQPLRQNPRALFIDIAYTLPERRRQGYMSRLCERAFEWALARGVHTLQLATPLQNISAIKFWEQMGFRKTLLEFELEIEK